MILTEGSVLIPKIDKKIEKKLQELKLKPDISPKKFLQIHSNRKHRYFSLCTTEKGERVAFYARLHFNLDAKRKMINEISFLKKLKKTNIAIKKFTPSLLFFGYEKDFEWFIRECLAGKPLGISRNLMQPVTENHLSQISEMVFKISKTPRKIFPSVKKFNVENYLAKDLCLGLVRDGFLKRELAISLISFIKKNFSLLKKENKYLSHGDLNLGNIVLEGEKIYFIDWELLRLNNFAFDIGYLWAHLWQAKNFLRKTLVVSYLGFLCGEKLKKFKILFPIVVSFLALGGIRNPDKERQRFYGKVFENCFSFEKLIKI